MRTREEQIADLANLLGEEGTFSFVDDLDAATKHILEAERRAEQRVRAEIGRGSERLNWRPIDSAPRDGSRILIVKKTGFVCTARCHDGDWEGDDGYCLHDIKFMAGWQPLPKPPETLS